MRHRRFEPVGGTTIGFMTDDLLALVGPDLLDDAARCAAAAGYRMIVADAADCRRAWLTSRAVLVLSLIHISEPTRPY